MSDTPEQPEPGSESESESESSSHPKLIYRRLPTRKLLRIERCDCSRGQEHSTYE